MRSRFNATYLLEPEDPMFVQIGNAFVEEYTKGIILLLEEFHTELQ